MVITSNYRGSKLRMVLHPSYGLRHRFCSSSSPLPLPHLTELAWVPSHSQIHFTSFLRFLHPQLFYSPAAFRELKVKSELLKQFAASVDPILPARIIMIWEDFRPKHKHLHHVAGPHSHFFCFHHYRLGMICSFTYQCHLDKIRSKTSLP